MKRKLEDRCKFAAVFAVMALSFWSCKKDDPNTIGIEILPGSDLAKVGHVIEKESNKSFTHNDTLVRTDGLSYNLFGTLNDPQFGKTKADLAFQFRIGNFPDFGEDPVIDSLVLSLLYKEKYGDTVSTQSLKVYELEEPIYISKPSSGGTSVPVKYYQDVDLKSLAAVNAIGEINFVPKFRLDSAGTDTLTQELRIKLDDAVANKLLNAEDDQMASQEAFLDFFKGVYVESQDIAETGGLVRLSTLAGGSKMSLYFTADFPDNADEDTVYHYAINSNSARVGHFEHDYSQAAFATNINSETTQDSLVYIQTMGGIRTKLEIPTLSNWRDSVKTGINKAELVFQIDTIASDYKNYEVPNQIVLEAINESGVRYFPADFSISPVLYGGAYNSTDHTYRFNITRHLQEIAEANINDYGFYLSTAFRSIQARRVVLKGASSQTGIRLEVTYTKYN